MACSSQLSKVSTIISYIQRKKKTEKINTWKQGVRKKGQEVEEGVKWAVMEYSEPPRYVFQV